MPEHPLGCSLDPAALAEVRSVYAAAAARYAASARFEDDRALVELRGAKGPIRALLDDMIAREAGCCPQFAFEVAETADGFQVEVRLSGASERTALRQAVATFFPSATVLAA